MNSHPRPSAPAPRSRPQTRRRSFASVLTLPLWVAALIGLLIALDRLGGASLALPQGGPAAWQTWAVETNPVTVTFALARVGAVVVTWYLLASTALSVAADLLRLRILARLADGVTAPAVRRLTSRALGFTLAGALAVPGTAWAANASAVPTHDNAPVLRHRLGDLATRPSPGGVVESTTTTAPLPHVTTAPAHEQEDLVTPLPATPPEQRPPEPVLEIRIPAAAEAFSGAEPAVHIVRPGENLWSIATKTVETAQPGASETDVVSYWLALVHHNNFLTDPDLVQPGQAIELPPLRPSKS